MPVFFVLLIVAVAGALLRRRLVLLLALGAIYVWGWSPFATFFVWTLERPFAAVPALPADAQAIVVLSGSFYPPSRTQPEILPGPGTYLRCEHAAWIYRHWKAVPVLATGGPVRGHGQLFDGTIAMAKTLEDAGVPAAMIWRENQSLTTYDNAVYSARLLRARAIGRVALVTEAFHMARAVRAFRRQGLEVAPAPCAFRAERFEGSWREWLIATPGTMVANEEALHEWVGLAWYAATGKG